MDVITLEELEMNLFFLFPVMLGETTQGFGDENPAPFPVHRHLRRSSGGREGSFGFVDSVETDPSVAASTSSGGGNPMPIAEVIAKRNLEKGAEPSPFLIETIDEVGFKEVGEELLREVFAILVISATEADVEKMQSSVRVQRHAR